ncbi:Lrp/AsnC family transcriptional regulator [Orrella sp. 11846]|uniref:Lrp/AsnC family transcriptional regulator n=1 Tax=Orrella sp. 11846 TaxID=3409913 RepID=UPI003B5CBAF1
MKDSVELDSLDLKLLDLLQTDSSLTNQALAEKVHASAPTCLRRVKRLRELGVIRKEVALLSAAHCGQPLTVIVNLTLESQAADEIAQFEQKLIDEPWVTQCYRVSSGADLVIILTLPDMPAYHALAHRLFTSEHKVRNVRSLFSSHCSKFETRIALKPAHEPLSQFGGKY